MNLESEFRMRYKQKTKRYSTRNNIYNTQEYLSVTVLIFMLSGVNLICAGFLSNNIRDEHSSEFLIFLGVMLIFMIPISILDKRHEMRSKLTTVLYCIMHLGFGFLLAFFFSWLWIVVCFCEILLCVLFYFIIKNKIKSIRGRFYD